MIHILKLGVIVVCFVCILVFMKGIIFVSSFWTSVLSFGKADAITIFPFIVLRREVFKDNVLLLNHERIHLIQALELLIIFFYFLYLLEFLVRYIQLKDFGKAYRRISFESEAFANQSNMRYIKERKFWGFLKYM